MDRQQIEAACEGVTGAAQGYAEAPRTITATVEVAARFRFGEALDACIHGQRITRAGWNGAGQYVTAQYPDKHSKMTQPYLVLRNAQNELLPWVPSQGDLFARDWAVLPVQPVHG
jgi:hypothetical protein